jgi:hypothetical protein
VPPDTVGTSWGEEHPTNGETEASWQQWETSLGVPVTVNDDQDWGKAVITAGTPAFGPVVDRGDATLTMLEVDRNRYDTGDGTVVIKIRGDVNSFSKFAGSPNWQVYTKPIVANWRYVQLRLEEG